MKKRSEALQNFLNMAEEALREKEFAEAGMERANALTQDILHKLELEKTTYAERAKLATQLMKCRQERRYYKDIFEETEMIETFLSDPQNKKVYEKLKQLLGQMRKAEKYHENRTYTVKIEPKDYEEWKREEKK